MTRTPTTSDDNSPAPAMAELKMRAEDADDVLVLSALLQDSLISASDLIYDSAQASFMVLANRYCWEAEQDGQKWRRLCGIRIGHVTRVRHQNVTDLSGTFYNLLSLSYDEAENSLSFIFSDDARIKCHIERLNIVLKDMAPPHPSLSTPSHD